MFDDDKVALFASGFTLAVCVLGVLYVQRFLL
jgi:hypothetical protein